MKRVGYIYEKICDINNIEQAIAHASSKKRSQKRVANVLENSTAYALMVRDILLKKVYVPAPYIIKTIKDGSSQKVRVISKPQFYPDQIVHWALMLQIQPVIMRGMYEYTCGSIKKRGTGLGRKMVRRWLDSDPEGTKYCLKMDISKFYPSVNNNILKTMFRRIIKDRDCLWLIDTIINSADGLPIGNYTSQWFANFYLQGLDHFIKETLRIKYYVRFADDLVLLGSDKTELHHARAAIAMYIESIDLKIKGDWQVFNTYHRDIDFLGYRFFKTYTIIRRRNSLRIKRRMKRISKKDFLNYLDACAIISYWGWLKHSNSYSFIVKYYKPYVSLYMARKVVSNHARYNPKRQGIDSERIVARGEADSLCGYT